ncbi:MAG: C25 family cysteine peptidase [Anaerolineae bacterium]|nr:C25 family cysteine peptidase [Anaerolineae bacterium]
MMQFIKRHKWRIHWALYLSLLLIPVVVGLSVVVQASDFSSDETGVQSVRADDNGVQFTFQTGEPVIDTDGIVTIAGLEERLNLPGAPALPIYSTLIALPPEATAAITVTAGDRVAQAVTRLQPVPTVADSDSLQTALVEGSALSLEAFGLAYDEDPVIYAGDTAYPAALYTLSDPQYIRDLRVVQLTLYPVQYNPVAGTLHHATELHVALRFEGGDLTNRQPAPSRDTAYTTGLRDLVLNYAQAEAGDWRSLPRATQNAAATALPVGQTAYKISVTEDGIYELSYADLAAAGMPVSTVDPNTFEMLYRGEPVAYEFIGDGDSQFESGEAVRFYGWQYEVDYTDPLYNTGVEQYPNRIERQHVKDQTNVFWLWAGGTPTLVTNRPNEVGNPAVSTLRVTQTTEVDVGGHPTFTNQWHTFDNEPDGYYWFTLSGGAARTADAIVAHPDPAGADAEILAEINSVNTGTHTVSVQLGTHPAFSRTWTGYNDVNITGTVPASALVDGGNPVTLDAVTTLEVKAQRLDVTYDRLLIADDNQLVFKDAVGGARQFDISGYTVGDVAQVIAWDVTNLNQPERIDVLAGAISGSNPYIYQVGSTHTAESRFIIANESGVKQPQIESYFVKNIDPVGGADWLAIAHADFTAATQDLANYRESALGGNYDAFVADVADVINQYGYGLPVPKGIRDYVHHALSWPTAPSYVVLVGDATANPRQTLVCAECIDFVPTNLLFIDRFQGQVPSDHPYATPDGLDDFPDLAVGRMTVKSVAELQNLISKTIRYEAAQADPDNYESWMYDILFTSDYTKVGAENFCLDNQNLAADNIPGSYSAKHLCLDDYMAGTTPTQDESHAMFLDIQSELDGPPLGNKGKSIVNYRGHGGIQTWGDHLVDIGINTPPYFWYNFTRPSVAISADCLDGNFSFFRYDAATAEYYDWPALSEAFLDVNGQGTVAHWSSSGLGYNGEHTILHEGFYKGMFEQHLRPIGDIVNYSKVRYLSTSGGHVSEVYAFILQGDPALKMPSTPEPPMPPTPTPTATPSPTMTPEFTPTPGPSPTPTFTPTPSPTPVDVKYIPVVKG